MCIQRGYHSAISSTERIETARIETALNQGYSARDTLRIAISSWHIKDIAPLVAFEHPITQEVDDNELGLCLYHAAERIVSERRVDLAAYELGIYDKMEFGPFMGSSALHGTMGHEVSW